MKKLLSLILVILLGLGFSVYVFAHGGGSSFNQPNRNYARSNDYRQDLNLSEGQLDSIEELQDEYRDQMHNLMDDMMDKNDDLRDLYFDKSVNRNEIIELEKEASLLRDKMYELMIEMKLDIRELLTAEQLENMEDYGMMEFEMFGMMGGRGFGGHMGGRGMMGGHMMHGNGMMGW